MFGLEQYPNELNLLNFTYHSTNVSNINLSLPFFMNHDEDFSLFVPVPAFTPVEHHHLMGFEPMYF